MNINTPKKSNFFMLLFLTYLLLAQVLLLYVKDKFKLNFSLTELQIIVYCLIFLPPVVLYRILSKKSFAEILPMKDLNIVNAALVILATLALMPVMMMLSALSSIFTVNEVSAMVSEMAADTNIIVNLVAIGILPAFLEEFIFRGIILNGYKGVKLITAALVNALLFSVIHLSLQQFLYTFMLGFIFVLMVHYTKSIYASIIAHFTMNGTQLVLATISSNALESIPDAAEPAEQASQIVWSSDLIFSMIFLAVLFTWFAAGLLYAFIKYNKKDNIPIHKEIYYGSTFAANAEKTIADDLADAAAQNTNELPDDENSNYSLIDNHYFYPDNFESGNPGNKIFNWPFFVIISIYIVFVIVPFALLSVLPK